MIYCLDNFSIFLGIDLLGALNKPADLSAGVTEAQRSRKGPS